MSDELPDGWTSAPIGRAFDVNPAKPPANALPTSAPVSFVPMAAVDADAGCISAAETRPFGQVRKAYTAFRDGDVILAKITPCFENGKAAVARALEHGLGFGSSEFHVFRSTGVAIPEYLFHFVRQSGFRREAANQMTGNVGQRRLPTDYLEECPIPIPPLAEQHRIVAKVEELLAHLKTARDRLDRVPAILKRFRQAVLAAACDGRLTEAWRQRRERGGRHPLPVPRSASVEPLDDTPDSWVWAPMDVLRRPDRPIIYGIIKPGPHVPTGVPYVRVLDMKNGSIDLANLRRAAPARAAMFARATLAGGDILISKDGTIGRVAIVPPELEGGNITQHLVRFSPDSVLSTEYLTIALRSPAVQRWLTGETRGAALQGVNVQDFRRLPLPIPPVEEQFEIAKGVRALFRLLDAVAHRADISAARAERLTSAILAKGFRGELVPTEAELARAEGRDYESAEALLERIRTQRIQAADDATVSGKRPTRRSRPSPSSDED